MPLVSSAFSARRCHARRLPAIAPCTLAALIASAAASAAPPEVVFERAGASVVVIERFDARDRRQGFASAVTIAPARVVTSCHALHGAVHARVRVRGESLDALLEYSDPQRDLCQLWAQGLEAPAARIEERPRLKVGQRVYAIGTPKGLERTLSEGLVSSLRPRAGTTLIQTSAPMSRGSSGGGLFDDEGLLIGIATFQYVRGQNLNFAVPASSLGELPGRAHERWRREGLADSALHPLGMRFLSWIDIGNAEAALRVAREWVSTAPADALPRHALGRAYAGLMRSQDAVDAFQSALRLRPDFARGWMDLGAVYAGLAQHEQAASAYARARELDSGAVAAWIGSGSALSALGRHGEAVDLLRHAVDIDDSYTGAWQALIGAHVAEGRLDLATAACRKALKAQPQSEALWHQFGLVLARQGEAMQAIQAQQEALRLKPRFVPAMYELGALYHGQGERARSREMYEQIRALDARLAASFEEHYLSQ